MDTDASGFISRREKPAKDGGIPDLSRQEARLWFYYRATRYIDCGYEALHMGQVHLYTANDKGMAKTTELFGMIMIREYAKIHGRRHKILLDAHTHGVNIRGKLLFGTGARGLQRRWRESKWMVRENYAIPDGIRQLGWTGR